MRRHFWTIHVTSGETETSGRKPNTNQLPDYSMFYYAPGCLGMHVIDGVSDRSDVWMATSRRHFGYVRLNPPDDFTTTHVQTPNELIEQ